MVRAVVATIARHLLDSIRFDNLITLVASSIVRQRFTQDGSHWKRRSVRGSYSWIRAATNETRGKSYAIYSFRAQFHHDPE
jgi:hypothetical protein